MKELHAEVEIAAPAERVWHLLTDFDRYPQWNPFIRRIRGRPEPGTKLEVVIQPSGARRTTFRPIVLAAEPNRELRWLGRLFLPGLFDGEHVFIIERIAPNEGRLVQREMFRGLFVPLLRRSLDRDTRRGFDEMNLALKKLAADTKASLIFARSA